MVENHMSSLFRSSNRVPVLGVLEVLEVLVVSSFGPRKVRLKPDTT
jgi:hypothetical protein